MANKRMFSKEVSNSNEFLDRPAVLYLQTFNIHNDKQWIKDLNANLIKFWSTNPKPHFEEE